jgi:hypothetical protein
MDDDQVNAMLATCLPDREPPLVAAGEVLRQAHAARRRRAAVLGAAAGVVLVAGGIGTAAALHDGGGGAPVGTPAARPTTATTPPAPGAAARLDAAIRHAMHDGAVVRGTPQRLPGGTWRAVYTYPGGTDSSSVTGSALTVLVAPAGQPTGIPADPCTATPPAGHTWSVCEVSPRPDGSRVAHYEDSYDNGAGRGGGYCQVAEHRRTDGTRVTATLCAYNAGGTSMIVDFVDQVPVLVTNPAIRLP